MAAKSARRTIVALAAAAMLGVGAHAQADTLTMNFDTVFSPVAPDPVVPPSGGTPWITATFQDTGTNLVRLTIALASTLGAGEFLSNFYLNFGLNSGTILDPSSLSFTGVPVLGTTVGEIGIATLIQSDTSTLDASFKADGDGYFDIRFDFPTAGAGDNRLLAGESVAFDISSATTPFSASTFFAAGSVSGGGTGTYLGAAHLQGIALPDGGTASAWIGPGGQFPPVGIVPVPPAVWLLGAGLVGLVGFARRKAAA